MLEYLKNYQELCSIDKLLEKKLSKESAVDHRGFLKFKAVMKDLPSVSKGELAIEEGVVHIKTNAQNDLNLLERLIPWRKGPFKIFNEIIDAEWRSDLKWNRIQPFLPNMKNHVILDVGCNNGYYMFRTLPDNPKLVLGIDPYIPYYTQFKTLSHFLGDERLQMELWGAEDLVHFKEMFDTIFYMGILYHHKNPVHHLELLYKVLRPGGTVIFETIGIPGDESFALFPEDRYANMRNVWFIPTLSCFINFIKKAKFSDIEIISDTLLTSDEQRLTKYCPPPHQSLDDFLDPIDPTKTIEGHWAPRRFAVVAKKV